MTTLFISSSSTDIALASSSSTSRIVLFNFIFFVVWAILVPTDARSRRTECWPGNGRDWAYSTGGERRRCASAAPRLPGAFMWLRTAASGWHFVALPSRCLGLEHTSFAAARDAASAARATLAPDEGHLGVGAVRPRSKGRGVPVANSSLDATAGRM